MAKRTFKTIYLWLHRWLGLATGLLFCIVCITGTLLVFEDELDDLLFPKFHFAPKVENTHKAPLSLDSLTNLAQEYAGDQKLNKVIIPKTGEGRNILYQTAGSKTKRFLLSLHPDDGLLAVKVRESQRLFQVITNIHRYLLMDKTGRIITGALCLSYVLILLTGLIIWWPKNRKLLKQRIKIKWDAKSKRLNWDVHAVGGFYTLPILFIIALTGLTWSYDWFENGLYLLFDGHLPTKTTIKPSPIDKASTSTKYGVLEIILTQTNDQFPYNGELEITFPSAKDPLYIVSKSIPSNPIPNRLDHSYYSKTGVLLRNEPYNSLSTGNQVRRLMLPIHSGRIFGWPTKLLAIIVTLIGASLPITGFNIWLGKRK
ncbi:Uncharacterized iron-regulated membrane protein [bacterium A37T11]|nr:Uncharacterized iron-regulated membrane protein [bacterium A37T11]